MTLNLASHRYAPPPAFITKLDRTADSEGPEIAKLARALGKPLMPWQRLVVQGATEKTPLGFYKYPIVVITVPRQSGKTTLVGPVQLHRIMTRPGIKAFFTAQTGKDAAKRMRDLLELVTSSPLSPLFKPRYAAGDLGVSLANRSSLHTFAPGPGALHGETPHLVTLDEIWKFNAVQGANLMGAIGPAQATLEGESQVWLISTMGTGESDFMNDLVKRGREGTPGIFYAEWSMPEGMDPYEPSTWWVFHPALGNTINEGYLVKEMTSGTLTMGEWMRAYMNRLTASTDPLVLAEDWAALNVPPKRVATRREIVVTYEVGREGVDAAVMASWRDEDGVACSRVLHHAPGIVWLVPFITHISEVWKPRAIAADDGGETKAITDELRRKGVEVHTIGYGDFATACVSWLALVRSSGSFRHAGEVTFAHAVARAVLQKMSDLWRFSRTNSPGSIAAVIASVVGIWVYDHPPEEAVGKPEISG